jgi:Uma2 family endonuclease
MSAYHNAGIPEYWVIDARDEGDIRFDIYKRGTREYTPGRKQAGWIKSAVLGQSFRLVQRESASGHLRFSLEVR